MFLAAPFLWEEVDCVMSQIKRTPAGEAPARNRSVLLSVFPSHVVKEISSSLSTLGDRYSQEILCITELHAGAEEISVFC